MTSDTLRDLYGRGMAREFGGPSAAEYAEDWDRFVATPEGKALVVEAGVAHVEDAGHELGCLQCSRRKERERLRAECAKGEHIRRMGQRECWVCGPNGLLADPEAPDDE